MKTRRIRVNPVARHGLRVNRSAVHQDKARTLKRNPRKAKGGDKIERYER